MEAIRWASMVFLLLIFHPLVSSSDTNYVRCERVANNWAESLNKNENTEDKLTLRDLLFFLHIPRTGGRAYYQCFLRKLYSIDQECPGSYDEIRFDLRKPNCNIVVSHNDYSLMSKFPEDRTSVVTILRDPIERVFSMYEFAVEVAARSLVHPNLTSALQKMSSAVKHRSSRRVSTYEVWPWKYLVPWMIEDLFARREARKLGKLKRSVRSDAYNTEDVVMPLQEFINHPIAREIIHNGATFQVAGLTNSSFLDDACEVRHCANKHPLLGQLVLEVAKKRLDQMLYVGFTENHKTSARMFASIVGTQILSRSKSIHSGSQPKSPDQTNPEASVQVVPDKAVEGTNHATSISDEASTVTSSPKENMTAEQLMRTYDDCVANLRNVQKARHTISLMQICPVNFTKEARRLVPDSVLKEMEVLNSLDMELYRHAQSIFSQQQILMDDLEKKNKQSTGQVPEDIYDSRNFWLLSVIVVPVVMVSVLTRRGNFCCIKLFHAAKLRKVG